MMDSQVREGVQDDRSSCSERGALVFFLAILLVGLVSFVILAIDTWRFSSAVQEARSNASYVALSALEAYFGAPQGTSDADRLQAAVERAREISRINFLAAAPESLARTINDTADDAPLLIPGRYYFARIGDENPCDPKEPPCFKPLAAGEKPNSFQLKGSLYQPIEVSLGKSIMAGTVNPRTEVTAALIPRHGCFLVDISPSMTYESHPFDPDRGPYNRFAFQLTDGGQPPAPNHLAWFQSLPGARGGAGYSSGQHYRDDYALTVPVINDTNFRAEDREHHPDPASDPARYGSPTAPGGVPWTFRIDNFRAGGYRGAEPLTSIFDGLRAAIREFRARQVAGDEACVIFYDDKLYWHRVFKLTQDFDYLEKFLDMNVQNDPARGFQLAMRYGLFPFATSATNTPLALSEAQKQLDEARRAGVPTSDFVVLISDGLTNCRSCTRTAALGNYCGDENRFGGCSNRADYFYYSAKEAEAVVLDTYVSRNIPIHSVVVGRHVGAHAVDRAGSDGRCLSEYERRQLTPFLPSIEPYNRLYPECARTFGAEGSQANSCGADFDNAFFSMSPTRQFYQGNQAMFELSVFTGGGWYPMRPVATGCVPSTSAPCFPGVRNEFDPLCRSMSTQIQSYVTEILRDSPFIIAETQ